MVRQKALSLELQAAWLSEKSKIANFFAKQAAKPKIEKLRRKLEEISGLKKSMNKLIC